MFVEPLFAHPTECAGVHAKRSHSADDQNRDQHDDSADDQQHIYLDTAPLPIPDCTDSISDRFISHMLTRNIRIEEDLIDQLFNSSEKRLARTLLLLARYGKQPIPVRMVPKISQDTLAEMVGTTRSRVNFFLNKFKKLGFIEYSGELPIRINNSLLSVVLHD